METALRRLPNEIQGLILGYVRFAFTNESLRATVTEYFEDRAACERRHGKIGTWDVGRVTDMSALFYRSHVDSINDEFDEDLGAWNTSSVKKMERTFAGCHAFEGRGIGAWDTSAVTSMHAMFSGCCSFNENIGAWDTSNVIGMTCMFDSCYIFNQDISSWNVSSVTEMTWMFIYCKRFNQNIRSWDTSSVSPVCPANFVGCEDFHEANRPSLPVEADSEEPADSDGAYSSEDV